jgi:vacuolar protein-sorting-associated protein 4
MSVSLYAMLTVDEKNERSKLMIKRKVSEYLERAEKLKDHLSKPAVQTKTAATANGVKSSGTKGKSVLVLGEGSS